MKLKGPGCLFKSNGGGGGGRIKNTKSHIEIELCKKRLFLHVTLLDYFFDADLWSIDKILFLK